MTDRKKYYIALAIFAAVCTAALILAFSLLSKPAPGNRAESSPSGAESAVSQPVPPAPAESDPASDPVSEIAESSLDNEESTQSGHKKNILLVNSENALPEGYEPVELIDTYSRGDRHFELARADIKLERAVYDALNALCAAAEAEGITGFILTDGYRTREQQSEIFASSPAGIAALPGHSEHETGLAFDISAYSDTGSFADTKQFAFISAHCAEYGFILRYPEGKEEVTGISYEPWHYRFVGREAAEEITRLGLTLEEYLAG